ncbi:MAG TPA: MBL fold metallo-hydrolase [Candidatus Polarisedimenticolaceae bacterium]|nr:MBL fold metallo-hydrolase [Candidatus Polarisedimenticolaceae bacterium]
MSEPCRSTREIATIVPGVRHWSVLDDRVGFRSEAYAIDGPFGRVLIDPLPFDDPVGNELEPISAICITGAFHQRSAWRLRRRFRVPVHAPHGAAPLVEPPDRHYRDGEQPLAGLYARFRHGPTNPHAVLVWQAPSHRVLFSGDLLIRAAGGPFSLVPDEHQQDPARTRAAVRALLDEAADVLCPAHGAPLTGGVAAAIAAAIAR